LHDRSLVQLASDWWTIQSGDHSVHDDFIDGADDEVNQLIDDGSEEVPALIGALASIAPDGALSYIGVAILEDLAMAADFNGRVDTTIDMLVLAGLDRPIAYEILAGPYPDFLERWRVRDRFGEVFTAVQLDALYDWNGRRNRRLVMSGDGFRLADISPWFKIGQAFDEA